MQHWGTAYKPRNFWFGYLMQVGISPNESTPKPSCANWNNLMIQTFDIFSLFAMAKICCDKRTVEILYNNDTQVLNLL